MAIRFGRKISYRSMRIDLIAEAGFQQAAGNLVTNLKTELAGFQERVRNSPEEVKVVARPGYGTGPSGVFEFIALAVLGAVGWIVRKKPSDLPTERQK